MIQCCFINTEDTPIRAEHICYFTRKESNDQIVLCEVYKEYYDHPDAPGEALVSVVLTRSIRSYSRHEQRAAPVIIMEAAQNNCKGLGQRG